jgi:hypothetical protein
MRDAGQATAEYAGLLALIAATFAAAAGTTGAAGEIANTLAGTVRTGLCLVGGDICRPSDARAAGLQPCTLTESSRGSGAAVTLMSLRVGEHGEWTVASRSDGTAFVTRTEDRTAGVAAGFGAEASPLGIELGVGGAYGFTVETGRAWEFPDAAAAARFIAGGDHDLPATWRFGDVGTELLAEAGAGLAGAVLSGLEASARAAAGARVGRGRTTLYFRARLEEPAPVSLVGGARSRGPAGGDLMLELTRDAGGLRELAFRRMERGPRPGRLIETVGRLDLRIPANRAAAAPLLARRLPWPPGVARDLRAVIRRTAQAGVVERAVYAVGDSSRKVEAAVRLGMELGIEVDRVQVTRRLVAASAWTGGSDERERVDCTGG